MFTGATGSVYSSTQGLKQSNFTFLQVIIQYNAMHVTLSNLALILPIIIDPRALTVILTTIPSINSSPQTREREDTVHLTSSK